MTGCLTTQGRALLRGGFRVLPIEPGTKSPNLKNWTAIKADEATLDRWIDVGKAGWGVGILGEETPAVDLDIVDEGVLAKMLAFCDEHFCDEAFGVAPRRIGRPPRLALVFRTDAPFQKMRSRKYVDERGDTHQVEIIGKGGQFVAYAIHPNTKKPYVWPGGELTDRPVDTLPLLTFEGARSIIDYFESIVPSTWRSGDAPSDAPGTHEGNPNKTAAIGLVESAVRAIPNLASDVDHPAWIRVAHALWSAVGSDKATGCAIFHEWSAKSDKYDPDYTQATWDGIKEVKSIGAGTLFHLAEGAGWTRPRADAASEFGVVEIDVGEPPAKILERPKLSRFSALTLAEALALADKPQPTPLIRGFLGRNAFAVIYGKPNDGKTFLALDMALAIASGQAWASMETTAGACVYIAAEGGEDVLQRVKAIAAHRQVAPETPFHIAPRPVNLFDPAADTEGVVAFVKGLAPARGTVELIVVDTLNRAMAGGSENDGADMGRFIANIDRIRTETGATVLVIHHAGKDMSKGSRGHSSLVAAVDTELEISTDGKTGPRILRTTKQRNMRRGDDLRFELRPVQTGVDHRGEPITSCFVCYPSADEFEPLPLTPAEADFLETLVVLCENATAVSVKSWAEAHCRRKQPGWLPGHGEPRGCSERQLRELRRQLLEGGRVTKLETGEFSLAQQK